MPIKGLVDGRDSTLVLSAGEHKFLIVLRSHGMVLDWIDLEHQLCELIAWQS